MSVRPAWEVREGERTTRWLHVRLAFGDGARIDVLTMVCDGWVCVEDVEARPALTLEDLAVLADWIEEPLARACVVDDGPDGATGAHRAGSARPDGERQRVARTYRAAQERGADPVLAVMDETGRSRRSALRLIGRSRDEGLLSPRHARR